MTKCETVNKVGSDQWKKSFTNYDHKHWSRLNDEPLDSEMGTISGDTSDLGKKGDIVFLGRSSDGKHYTLYGPITPEEYKKILHKNNQSLKNLDISRNLE
jgi:hypothetical protein